MESLDSILSRVLQNASEKVAQRVQPALNRRPLRDPDNPSAVLQSVSSSLANIRSPETASAMAQAVRNSSSSRFATPDEQEDFNNSGFGIPAEHHRKTTISDDANVLGTVGTTGSAIVSQIASAGRALSGIPDAANSFREAVSEMADSASSAAPVIDSVSGPLSKMAGAIVSQISGIGSKAGRGTGPTAESVVDGSGSVRRMLKAPKSFSAWFGGDQPDSVGKKGGSAQTWLESSSIADSVREMVANVTRSMEKLQSNTTGLLSGGLSASRFSGGIGGASGGGDSSSLSGRIGDSFDRILAKSFLMFRGMSPAASGSGGGGDSGSDGNGSGRDASSGSGGSGMFRGIRNQIRGRIGNAGRRMMARYFRNNVVRGRRLLRGGVAGGGGVPAGGGIGGIGGAARGMAGAGAVGGAAGGGGGAGVAAAGGGGAAGVGVVAGGAVLGVLAFVAALAIAVDGVIKLGKQGYETALRVSHLDGTLTAAKAQLDVSRLLRDVQTARNLSEPGAKFMAALDNLEAAFRPITDMAMGLGLESLALMANAVAEAFRGVVGATAGLVRGLNDFEKKLGKDWIPDDLAGKMEEFAKGGGPRNANIIAAPLHEMFLNMPPAAPPRPLIPPIGQNGNGNGIGN